MKKILLTLSCIFLAVSVSHGESSSELEAAKKFPAAAGESTTVFETNFDAPQETKLPGSFTIVPGAGRNGSAALHCERTDSKQYITYSVPLPKLVPGRNYSVSAWVRGEGIRRPSVGNSLGTIYVEHYRNQKWVDGTYFSASKVGTDWEEIVLHFTAPPEGAVSKLGFYFVRGATGKIWFDDVTVRSTTFPPTILLTRPDRLSFFGDDGRFRLRVEASAPKRSKILVGVVNGGKVREMLLAPDGLDFQGNTSHGNAGKLEPGPVEIHTRLLDMEAKHYVAEQSFLLQAYPATPPPENACVFDDYGRAIVNGKPFMPLGVYSFPGEENYKRLRDAGFNCLQLYGSLSLKGNVDHKDHVKNVREGLDLIDRHGLKLIFSLKDQFPHRGAVRKWGGVEGIDAVTEHAVRTVKDHPGLLAWYISDEEMRQAVPTILELRQRISRIDPWHPVWTLTDHYSSMYLPYYGISGDMIGVDPYPLSEKHIEQSIKRVRVAMDAAQTTGLPIWVVPQIFNWGIARLKDRPEEFAKSHFPSVEEMRAMALYAAVLGAKGFVFYSNDTIRRYDNLVPGTAEKEWPKVVEMVKSVKELEPFVLSTKKPLEIAVQSEPAGAVEAGALLDDAGNFRIIVIGTGGKAKGTFTLPEELLKLKKEPLTSKFGKTKPLGGGRYEFNAEAVDSDILE